MTNEVWLLLCLILVGACFGVVHMVTLWQGLRAEALGWRWRLLALLPPVTPVVAWRGGRRVAPGLWCATLVLYIGLRLVA